MRLECACRAPYCSTHSQLLAASPHSSLVYTLRSVIHCKDNGSECPCMAPPYLSHHLVSRGERDLSYRLCHCRTECSHAGTHSRSRPDCARGSEARTVVPLVQLDVCPTERHFADLYQQFVPSRRRKGNFLVLVGRACKLLHQPIRRLGQRHGRK